MSVANALKAARVAGIRLGIDGDDLVLEAAAPPSPAVLDLLKCHKPEIVKLLRRQAPTWTPADWQAFFDERAAVLEFDQGMTRQEAERLAFEACVVHWLNRNAPIASDPDKGCAGCGEPEGAAGVVVPFGLPDSATWLHHKCWRPWSDRRKANAVEALVAMGILQSASA